uniref:Uncharacterized protein n=1 Tax=Nelumbo nucifera TaxID=4432 RepID=A0A822ZF52_NELNU|nr:TPA_asm: hypothetical protein HUJ06_001380 [Nelumbo nucifera]
MPEISKAVIGDNYEKGNTSRRSPREHVDEVTLEEVVQPLAVIPVEEMEESNMFNRVLQKSSIAGDASDQMVFFILNIVELIGVLLTFEPFLVQPAHRTQNIIKPMTAQLKATQD